MFSFYYETGKWSDPGQEFLEEQDLTDYLPHLCCGLSEQMEQFLLRPPSDSEHGFTGS